MNIRDAEEYFYDRLDELRRMCVDGTAWVFLCAATMIDYLSKLANGKDRGGEGYKAFVNEYMSKIRPEYSTFTYADGRQDLPTQIYHVFRCGVVHSFSFIPDVQAQDKGGRKRSIVISHRQGGQKHLSRHSSVRAPDSCNLVAEDFIDDLSKAIQEMFSMAKEGDNDLKENIERWITNHPPIMGEKHMGSAPKKFLADVQKFIAISAVGVSALRGQGAGVIDRVRKYLGEMHLSETRLLRDEVTFCEWLDDKTNDLVCSQEVKWGAARKALNLFLRDCLYNRYLSSEYSLDQLESLMEIPLDSVIAGQLKRNAGRGQLPIWPGLKGLKKEDSKRFQDHASGMAAQEGVPRVHLDIGMWVNNR